MKLKLKGPNMCYIFLKAWDSRISNMTFSLTVSTMQWHWHTWLGSRINWSNWKNAKMACKQLVKLQKKWWYLGKISTVRNFTHILKIYTLTCIMIIPSLECTPTLAVTNCGTGPAESTTRLWGANYSLFIFFLLWANYLLLY